MENQNNSWIISRSLDTAMFLGPVLIAGFFAILFWNYPQNDPYPLWVFVALIISVDVAHVWATAYRVYLDPDEISRRPLLYLPPIPIIFLSSVLLHLHNPSLFWTVIAYYALWHFLAQPYGFIAIYKFKAGERNPLDYRVDKIATWTAGLGPILYWHASPQRFFDWFDHGEFFLFRIPSLTKPWILGLYGMVFLIYLSRQLYLYFALRQINAGKQIVMGLTWVTWALGIFLPHPLASAAFINLFHGVPFLGITWLYCHKKWDHPSRAFTNPFHLLLRFLSKKQNWIFFYALLFLPALVEELLWDGLIWNVYLPALVHLESSSLLFSAIVGLLALPQILHYFLDSHIWKFQKTNPDLRENLGLN